MSIELKDTIELMNSKEWKDRFKAEYFQLLIRIEKLQKIVIDYGKDFIPNCPYTILRNQLVFMKNYLHILEQRSKIENIDLTVDENGIER